MEKKLKPSALFTDGAVLCRGKEIRLFGEAAEGVCVSAALTDAAGKLLARGETIALDGKFLISLPPQAAQEGCRITFAAGAETSEAGDIAIGDVYLAGGQSNMELELQYALEGPETLPDLKDPLLRFFNVPKQAYDDGNEPQFDRTSWHMADPENGKYNSAVATLFARKMREKHPDIPLGIIGCYWGGTSVTCWMDEDTLRETGEGVRYTERYNRECGEKTIEQFLREEKEWRRTMDAWDKTVADFKDGHPGCTWPEITAACGPCPWFPPKGPGSPFRPHGLVHMMFDKVCPVSLTGVLYYQGEEDAGQTDRYDELMAAMIRLWRKKLRAPELPFLFVQLPMWLDFEAEDTFQWAKTRLSQAAVRDAVRNTGMICLLDEGEYGNIHPVKKRPVGERLAELALAMAGENGKVSPQALDMYADGDTLAVRLTQPVKTSDGEAPRLLEIAGGDGKFVPAEGEISGSTLRLKAEGIKHPVKARYAWTDWSDKVNLFGGNGLPLEPFSL